MDMRKLRYFLTVAEEGQITKAAQKLHMAQPPLSQQIKLLESELGVKLIERSGSRKIQLTAAGQMLRVRAKQLMALSEKTATELKDIEEGLQGTLPIAIAASWDAAFLPKKIHSFREQFPRIHFQIWEGDADKVEELLRNGIAEIGIMRIPANSDHYEKVILQDESFVAAIPAKDAAGIPGPTVRLLDLADKPLIICQKHESLLHCFRELGSEPTILCRHTDVRSMLAWAVAGLGVAIVPQSAANFIPNDHLRFKKIVDPPLKTVSSAVVWLKSRYLSTAARNFITIFTQAES